jgi:hypothetical protein
MIATMDIKNGKKGNINKLVIDQKGRLLQQKYILIHPEWCVLNFMYHYNQNLFKQPERYSNLSVNNIIGFNDSSKLKSIQLSAPFVLIDFSPANKGTHQDLERNFRIESSFEYRTGVTLTYYGNHINQK